MPAMTLYLKGSKDKELQPQLEGRAKRVPAAGGNSGKKSAPKIYLK